MILISLYYGLIIVVTLFYASVAEALVHRYWMHRPYTIFGWTFRYPFDSHTGVHHRIFGGDKTYKLENHPIELQEAHAKTIPMSWWNGPALTAIALLPFVVWSLVRPAWQSVTIIGVEIFLYYVTYEFSHYCMHDHKKKFWFECKLVYLAKQHFVKTKLFQWIDRRHDLHHIDMRTNFNVVFPFADWIFGTLNEESAWPAT